MSRPIPNVTLGGYRPNQVKINSIGIGIDDETLDNLNLNSAQYMVVGGQDNGIYNLIVDNEGVAINSSIIDRYSYSNEYALYVDGNIFINGKVDTIAGTLSNIAGGGGAFACNYWMPVRRDIPSSTNIFYDGRINIANESQSRSNTYRVNIVDSANYNIKNAQLAIQNQVGAVARTAIIGYSNLSPVVINSAKGPIEFHAARDQAYFDSVYYRSSNLPKYTSSANAPHLVINTDGNVGIKVTPNPPLSYNLRTFSGINREVDYTPITNQPVDLHVNGAMFSCNIVMYDYESDSAKNIDDLYVRKLGVSFAASQVEPGYFAPGNYTFRSNISIGGPIEDAYSLSIYGKMHIMDQLYADKAFLTSNIVAQDTLEVFGTTYFENDVTANENLQVNQNLVIWGGLYADSNSIYAIVPGGSNQNTTTKVSFVGYTADGWSNIYPQGAGFITPGKAGVGINSEYDTTPGQVTVISRDSNIYSLALIDKTNVNFTKALFVGHQRSNVINGVEDASVIFATPSSTSSYFSYSQNSHPQNMYFYPGKYDKTIQGNNTATDHTPPTLSLYETGQAAVNSFKPNSTFQFYVDGNIGFSSNLYVFDTNVPTKLAKFKYGPVVGITNDTGISYNDTTSPYVGINRDPDNRYGLAVKGGIQADNYYTSNNRRGVLWIDSTTANADVYATTSDGVYAISKVGIGLNQPSYMLDIQGNNDDMGNNYGTYIRLNKSTLDESLSNTGIRFDGTTQPWFVNVEDISTGISRYSVGCSPDVYSLVDSSTIMSYTTWSSNTSNIYGVSSNINSIASYLNTSIATSNLSINSSNIINNSNIYNIYNITNLSNVTSNITSNINNIPNIPAISSNISYTYTTFVNTGVLTTLSTSSNYDTPSAPTRSNIVNTSNVINTSNITNTSNIYYYVNTSNYSYSSNTSGIIIQHDLTKGNYGHQVVIGGNASLVNTSYNNPNPNPNAVLTVNGDTSIIGSLNVTGYITANNTVPLTTSARSNIPNIEEDDLFISGKDVFINPTNKMYVNYTQDMLNYAVEQTNQAAFNVYQDIYNSTNPAPIAHFVAEGDNAYIEIMSKSINNPYILNKSDNDGILRIGILPESQDKQLIGFQDGKGNSYMTFRKLGASSRAMGINTSTPDAQLHILNNTTSLNDTMFKITYDNGGSGDTANYTPNITFEKKFSVNADTFNKQWIIQGPTYGNDLYDQLSFKYVSQLNNTITSNTVLSITSNGCIGINNTTPTYLLDIVTSNINDGRNHGIRLWNKQDLDTAQLVFQSGNSPDIGGDEYADYIMYSCNNEFIFRQRKTNASLNPLLYFNSNIQLGINANPDTKYDVNIGGTLNVTQSIRVNGYELFNTSNITTSGSTIIGNSNIYLLPTVDTGGGVVINGNFSTGNLFHIFNDDTGSANMTVYDSILNTGAIYYRNKMGDNSYNVYQMYNSNTRFGLSYENMGSRDYTMPTNGLTEVFFIDGVQSTSYQEHDMTINGNLSVRSSIRGLPQISIGSNGTIIGNDQLGSLSIMPGHGSHVGIGTTLPRSMLDIYGDLLVSANIGIGTTIAKEKLDINGNMNITGNILPSQCNVFDIGSSNYRFRDIYLSGNTIDLDGTLIQRDSVTGGIKITNESGNSLDTTIKTLYATDNVGIGTTILRQKLDVIGSAIVSSSIGIGTTVTANAFGVSGAIAIGSTYVGTTAPTNGIIVSGNVGIGTTITRQKLDIFGSAIVSSSIGIGTTVTANALGISGAVAIGSTYTGVTAPANGMIVSGSVGIGTTNIVSGTSLAITGRTYQLIPSPSALTSTTAVSDYPFILHAYEGGTTSPYNALAFATMTGGITAQTPGAVIQFRRNGANGYGALEFCTKDTTAALGPVLPRITLFGENVGIGTTIPRQMLDVQGGDIIVTGNIGIGTTLPTQKLDVVGNIKASGQVLANASDGVNTPSYSWSGDTNTGMFNAGENIIGFTTNGGEKMRIIQNGNVGIGTAIPQQKLDIFGSAIVSSSIGIGTTVTANALGVSGAMAIGSTYIGTVAPANGIIVAGNVGIGTSITRQNLDVAGTAIVSSSIGIGTTITANALGVSGAMAIGSTYIGTVAPANGIIVAGNVGIGTSITRQNLDVIGTAIVSSSIGIGTTLLGNYSLNVIGSANISTNVTANTFIGNLAGIANSATIASNALGLSGIPNIIVGSVNASTATISGTLITSNLTVLGSNSTVNTYTISTSNVSISNITGTGPALCVSQKGIGAGYPIADFYDVDVSTTVPVFRIADGGNIGIGTTAPSDKLQVYGNIRIGGSGDDNTNYYLQSAGQLNILADSTSTNSTFSGLRLDAGISGSTVNNHINFATQGKNSMIIGYNQFVGIQPNQTTYDFNSPPPQALSVLGNSFVRDNVGIGTTIMRQKLDVFGSAIVSSSVGIGTTVNVNALGVSGAIAIGSTYTGTVAPTDGMIVSGNVGIGTTLPRTIFHTRAPDPSSVNGIIGQFSRDGAGDIGISFTQSGVISYGIVHRSGGGLAFVHNLFPTGSGTERMRIDHVGNVGIGTTIVRKDLDVIGTAIVSSSIGIGTTVTANALGVSGAMAIGSTYIGTIAPANGLIASGNIGIGTNITRQKLDIIGTAIVSSSIGIGTTVTANALGVSGAMAIGSTYIGTTAPANGIIVSGNIGIGTTITQRTLDIFGDINFTGNIYQSNVLYSGSSQWVTSGTNIYYTTGNVGIGTTNPVTKFQVADANLNTKLRISATDSAINSQSGIEFGLGDINNGYNPAWSIYVNGDYNYGTGKLIFSGRPNGSGTSSIERLTIKADGNVGIGTTSPSTTLHVNGIVSASTFSGIGQGFSSMEVKTSGTSWTVPANVYKIKVTVIGGGGGGGGSSGTNANTNGSAGSGGGSGGLCIGFCNVTPGQTLTYAIGAAGAASTALGTSNGGNGGNTTITIDLLTFTANGGGGGFGNGNGAGGGSGGTATGGTLNLSGQNGGDGGIVNTANYQLIFPHGGNTPLGFGYSGFPVRGDTATVASTGYGAGGTAACVSGGTGAAKAGAAGTTGALIIEY